MMKTIELSSELIKLHKYDGGSDKRATVDLIKTYLEKNNLHVELITSNGIVSVIGSTKGRKENSKKIILNGHYDTVPPSSSWTVDPFKGNIKGGYIWGLGVVDMTCNLAAMINTSITLSKEKLPGEVVVVAVGDEEKGGHNGTKATLEKGVAGDYAVIGEPTGMKLAVGHKSIIEVELVATGKSAHSAFPVAGKNAIHMMAKVLNDLVEEYKPKFDKYEELFDQITLTTGTIRGGTAVNVVADKCTAELNFRLPPKMDKDKFLNALQKQCGEVKVNTLLADNGWICDEKSDYVHTASQLLERITGSKTQLMHKLGGNDARFYSAAGIPTINVGAGNMKLLHAPDERVSLTELKQVEQYYCELSKKLLA